MLLRTEGPRSYTYTYAALMMYLFCHFRFLYKILYIESGRVVISKVFLFYFANPFGTPLQERGVASII